MRILLLLLLTLAASSVSAAPTDVPWVGKTFTGTPCTGVFPGNNYGPLDYNTQQAELHVVHKAHFSEAVEFLQPGTEGAAGRFASGGINYTLAVCPNHHRALNSVIQLQLRNRAGDMSDRPLSPAECYLQRALSFTPGDATVYMLYGMLLHRYEMYDEALQAYQRAVKLSPGSANLDYNYALLLTDMERYAEAKKLANKLYGAGFPLPGLKKKLSAAGEWP
jgi:tetratricopeptide (TPR) repeat protein